MTNQKKICPRCSGNGFIKIKESYLKSFGLSERKASYLKNLSNYLVDNNSFNLWNNLKDEEINSRLLKLRGIGPWSIKMFLIFSLRLSNLILSLSFPLLPKTYLLELMFCIFLNFF